MIFWFLGIGVPKINWGIEIPLKQFLLWSFFKLGYWKFLSNKFHDLFFFFFGIRNYKFDWGIRNSFEINFMIIFFFVFLESRIPLNCLIGGFRDYIELNFLNGWIQWLHLIDLRNCLTEIYEIFYLVLLN